MLRLRFRDRRIGWAGLLALLLATLAPGITHALSHLRGESMPWSLLCSASGNKRVVLDAPSDAPAAGLQHAFEHCSSCSLHLDAAALPPAPRTPSLRSDLALALRALPAGAPHTWHAWHHAQPRAPPAIA